MNIILDTLHKVSSLNLAYGDSLYNVGQRYANSCLLKTFYKMPNTEYIAVQTFNLGNSSLKIHERKLA